MPHLWRNWTLSMVAALVFAACGGGTADWPLYSLERAEFKSPSGTLYEEVAAELWAALLSRVEEVRAFGWPPLIADAMDMPFGGGDNGAIDYRTTELSVDCAQGGTAHFARQEDEELADRVRVEFRSCRYDVIAGALLFPQELDGVAWGEVEEGGLNYLHYQGDLYVDGHKKNRVLGMAWGFGDLKLNVPGGGGDVIADVDVPGLGLSGTVTLTATNGTFECQVDAEKLYCVDVDGLASFEASVNPGKDGARDD